MNTLVVYYWLATNAIPKAKLLIYREWYNMYMQNVRRLYNFFQPDKYQLNLTIDRLGRRFRGTVHIHGNKTLASQPVILHAKDLNIKAIIVNGQTTDFVHVGSDELVVKSEGSGEQTIVIEFDGHITDSLYGLYPCYYEHEGVKKELLMTQFESHYARELLPCIDEPEAKAVFEVTLTTEKGVTVLGNMPIASQSFVDETMRTVFEPTPQMSTYLLAFVIGELQKKSATTHNGVEVNVYATLAQPLEGLDFALEAAVGSIDFFDSYFDTPYPLKKLDHVAVPDFSSGAMENWGLVTYRELALITDKNSSVSMKQYVATVIAHETSHQWFGNLVTMKWWDELWLNESFATIMEYIAVDSMYPQWHIWDSFATHEAFSALRRDQLSGVQPVQCSVNHPDEITTLFDPAIVYAKGGRLLNMLRTYIGENSWRIGLKKYFQAHAYSNTTGSDLWQALGEASNQDVAKFMDTWLSQPGFPVVEVKSLQNGYKLAQRHFVLGGEASSTLWPIPLHAYDDLFPQMLNEPNVDVSSPRQVPFLNVDNTSHFITKYDDEAFANINKMNTQQKLAPIDRLAFLHETMLLARANELSTDKLIPLLLTYANERYEAVWDIIASTINDLKRFVEQDETAESNLKKIVIRLAGPLYDELGYTDKETDSEQTIKLRATIIGLLSYADHSEVTARCLEAFRATGDVEKLPSEIRAIVFVVAAKNGDQNDFTRLLEAYDATANAELQTDLTAGLTATRSEANISTILSRMLNTKLVRPQDTNRWFAYMIRSRYAREATWSWMMNNWTWIEQTFAGDKSYDSFPLYSAGAFSTQEWYARYHSFFMPLSNVVALHRTIEIGLTDIKSRAEWIQRDQEKVFTALAANV